MVSVFLLLLDSMKVSKVLERERWLPVGERKSCGEEILVSERFKTLGNPISKIHFLIFLNFLGNQTVDHLVSYLIPLFSCR